ncbi:excalibur calcium-binding domain-containing protein [Pseudokineococcus sp. 5B2Z-1]|uniref:excalibur calcium-binding domain-containing protein n=1 Tax=Pseudokineococcus sp. 5B2Z-1 TaxID=3132744 RepID=UPI0030AD0B6F
MDNVSHGGTPHMRTYRTALSVALAAGVVGLAGSPALAADPYDCDDFSSQAEAQAEFDRVSGDPSGLDRDDDGQACENTDYPSSGSGSTGGGEEGMAMPSGGVDAGAGGTAGDVGALLASGGLLAAAGVGGLVVARRRSAG